MQFYYKSTNKTECGVDEAGRGCLAGPVVAGAVVWNPELNTGLALDIKDSKKISKKKREILAEYIRCNALAFGIGVASQQEIDQHNILNATFLAMHRAIDQITLPIDMLLIDGDRFQNYIKVEDDHDEHDITAQLVPHTTITNGDAKMVSIAAASILAKTTHDRLVKEYLDEHPECAVYDWENNMCYGTKSHIASIDAHGQCSYHRKTFRKK